MVRAGDSALLGRWRNLWQRWRLQIRRDPAQIPNSVSIGSSKAGDGNAIFANNGEEKVLDALAKSGSLSNFPV
jgi:hypothetical protein